MDAFQFLDLLYVTLIYNSNSVRIIVHFQKKGNARLNEERPAIVGLKGGIA